MEREWRESHSKGPGYREEQKGLEGGRGRPQALAEVGSSQERDRNREGSSAYSIHALFVCGGRRT
jgi:hypothetical protein